jgi:glycosyltransferase involved in cell wall biosynthesis
VQKLSILVPVFNEKKTLVEVLDAVIKADTLGLEKELIVVDDGSTDGTREILENLDCAKYNAKVQP